MPFWSGYQFSGCHLNHYLTFQIVHNVFCISLHRGLTVYANNVINPPFNHILLHVLLSVHLTSLIIMDYSRL